MTIVSGLLGKAQNLLGKAITRKTKVYDASKNRFVVAGITLDGLTSVELSGDVISKTETGIDSQYYAYYETFENITARLTVLPTAQCNDVLKALKHAQTRRKGWVMVSMYDNGNFVGDFHGHLISAGALTQGIEAGDIEYTFGLYPLDTTIIANTLTQETPVAIEPDSPDYIPQN